MNSHDKSFAPGAAEADRKRAVAKKLIEKYYYQLTQGCGNPECNNSNCASCPYNPALKPNQAAALALRLFKSKARLCVSTNTNGSTLRETNFIDSQPCQVHGLAADLSEPVDRFSNSELAEKSVLMDTDYLLSSTSERRNEACPLTFPVTTDVDSVQGTSPPMCEFRSEPSVAESLTNTVLIASSPLSHVITDSSASKMLIDTPIAEEPDCMDVSFTDFHENGESEQKTELLQQSDSQTLVPCHNNESILSEPSSSNLNPTTSNSDSKTGTEGTLYLDEDRLLSIIDDCRKEQKYSLLIRTLGHVFSSEDSLQNSFVKQVSFEDMCKEDIRAMEVDEDKDQDSKEPEENQCESVSAKNCDVTVDVESVRRAFKALFSIQDHPFQGALINALLILSENLEFDLKYGSRNILEGNILNIFVIVMEIPMLECTEYMESAFPAFCKAAAFLPVPAQAKLAQAWSKYDVARLKEMTDTLHQFITLKVVTGQFSRDFCINDDEAIVAATKLMKILYFASMLGGVMDSESPVVPEENEPRPEEAEDNFQDLLQGAIGPESKEPKEIKEDVLAQELGLKPIDCRNPVLSFEEFYNEPLSDQIEMDRDFACYKTEGGKFSFMNYAFILTPAVKALGLYYDNRIRMYSERRISVLHSLVHGAPPNPYLKLRVRRDHLIDDALVGLEMVAMESPNNLKKQLVVEFEGEQGIDEGGVSKEFFQLVVEEVFNPDFAMFTLNAETQTYWFNPTSFESDAQFTLIGIILGLAIYNNIILDVHFPMVLYRKLMGKKGTFYDLQEWNPSLSKGLHDLLAYEGDDIETVFLQTYRIIHQDVFGTVLTHDLKENGDKILVNQSNKKEFVELYASFLLNKAVEKQFRAFKRGFQMVTDDSPLRLLFRPEEIELLVCGSKNFDFNALEEATDYDGGYAFDTPIIKWFWELVHEFSLDQKRKLLQFATGSDRVPVGGLSKLKLVIARHGPDSDRLPTAHTCFNVLLLPEYGSKEKLEERFLKAINYSKGFGML